MAQVVESEVIDPGFLEHFVPDRLYVLESPAGVFPLARVTEDVGTPEAPREPAQHLGQVRVDRNVALASALAFADRDDAPVEVDVGPLEVEDFALSHPRVRGGEDDGPQIDEQGFRALPALQPHPVAGQEELRIFPLGEVPQALGIFAEDPDAAGKYLGNLDLVEDPAFDREVVEALQSRELPVDAGSTDAGRAMRLVLLKIGGGDLVQEAVPEEVDQVTRPPPVAPKTLGADVDLGPGEELLGRLAEARPAKLPFGEVAPLRDFPQPLPVEFFGQPLVRRHFAFPALPAGRIPVVVIDPVRIAGFGDAHLQLPRNVSTMLFRPLSNVVLSEQDAPLDFVVGHLPGLRPSVEREGGDAEPLGGFLDRQQTTLRCFIHDSRSYAEEENCQSGLLNLDPAACDPASGAPAAIPAAGTDPPEFETEGLPSSRAASRQASLIGQLLPEASISSSLHREPSRENLADNHAGPRFFLRKLVRVDPGTEFFERSRAMAKQVYAGMDVHLNSIAVVWGGVREKARNVVVPNSEEGLRQLVDTIGREGVWAVYEASSAGFEVFDELTRLGWKVSVVAPTHIPKSVKSRKRKTDVEDAKRLWEVLIAHGELGTAMPAVWIPGPQLREDREVVRRRLQLGESLCRVKNRITALLRMHQTRRPKEIRTPWSQKHVAWLRGLCESGPVGPRVREMLRSYLRELEFLNAEVEEVSAQLESLAREDAYRSRVDKLTGRLGVGILTAMTFLLELGDMDRFNNRRQIASYLGLVPTSHESGEADNRKGHITRMGPVRIRKVLNQAAWAIVRDDPAWRSTYDRLSTRRGPKKAIVALMRKLGIELWQLAKSA